MYQGASSLSLDAKGRMSVPTRHRDALIEQEYFCSFDAINMRVYLGLPIGMVRTLAPCSYISDLGIHNEDLALRSIFIAMRQAFSGPTVGISGNSPLAGVIAFIKIVNWRTQKDSNLRPLPSEGSTLSS